MNQASIVAFRVFVRGKVQGVGYRESMRIEAERLGVTGWVRNRHDGGVEAVIQGESKAIEALLQWVHEGPPAAKVLRVDVKAEAPQTFTQFSRWPTA